FIPTLLLGLLIPAAVAFILGYFIFRSRIKGVYMAIITQALALSVNLLFLGNEMNMGGTIGLPTFKTLQRLDLSQPSVNLRVYMAIITQALALSVYLLFLRNETNMGGTNGLTNFKTLLGFDLSQPAVKLGLYMVSLATLAGVYQICRHIVGSKFGKVLLAIRDSESRVSFTAYRVLHYKLTIFIIAAVIGAIAGMLYVPQTGIITPGRMDVKASVEMLMWVALG